MGKHLVAIVAVALLVIGGMLDFSLMAKARAGAPYSLADHVAARIGLVSGLFPVSGMAKLLPPAPQGWTVRSGRIQDSFAAAGKEPTAEELASAKLLDATMRGGIKGYKSAWWTYENGAKLVTLEVSFVPAGELRSEGARKMRLVYALLARDSRPEPVVEFPGLAIAQVDVRDLPAAQFYYGHIGDQVYVSAASNADPADTLALLRGIDAAALVKMLAEDTSAAEAEADKVAADRPVVREKGCSVTGSAKFCSVGD